MKSYPRYLLGKLKQNEKMKKMKRNMPLLDNDPRIPWNATNLRYLPTYLRTIPKYDTYLLIPVHSFHKYYTRE